MRTLLVYAWVPFRLLGRPGVSALFGHRTALADWGDALGFDGIRRGRRLPEPWFVPMRRFIANQLVEDTGFTSITIPGSTDTRKGFALSTMFPRLCVDYELLFELFGMPISYPRMLSLHPGLDCMNRLFGVLPPNDFPSPGFIDPR